MSGSLEEVNGGDPAISLHSRGGPDKLAIGSLNLGDEELGLVTHRLREELLR